MLMNANFHMELKKMRFYILTFFFQTILVKTNICI